MGKRTNYAIAFVRHQDRKAWESLGWQFDHDEDRHAAVGSIYRWLGSGEPEYPGEHYAQQVREFDAVWPGASND